MKLSLKVTLGHDGHEMLFFLFKGPKAICNASRRTESTESSRIMKKIRICNVKLSQSNAEIEFFNLNEAVNPSFFQKNNGVCCRSTIFKSFHVPPSVMRFLNVMAVMSNSRRICRKRSTNFRQLSSLAHFL